MICSCRLFARHFTLEGSQDNGTWNALRHMKVVPFVRARDCTVFMQSAVFYIPFRQLTSLYFTPPFPFFFSPGFLTTKLFKLALGLLPLTTKYQETKKLPQREVPNFSKKKSFNIRRALHHCSARRRADVTALATAPHNSALSTSVTVPQNMVWPKKYVNPQGRRCAAQTPSCFCSTTYETATIQPRVSRRRLHA